MGWLAIGNERASGVFATSNGPAAQQPTATMPAMPTVPEDPAVTAARQLLQASGHMVIDPFVPAA